jgi:hypothetical protein
MKNIFEKYFLRRVSHAAVFLWAVSVVSCNFSGGESAESSEAGKSSNANLKLSPGEYVKWVKNKENGLRKEKTIDDVTFSLQYKPYPYIVCLEQKKNTIADTLLKKRVSEIDNMQYYDLVISLKSAQCELLKYKIGSADDYQNRVKYFSFDMQHDIRLVDGGDTLPCALYHFERIYDIAPYCTFLLGFPLDKNHADAEKTLVYYDRIFGKGTIKFTYVKNEINNTPKLTTL